jgi:chitinase
MHSCWQTFPGTNLLQCLDIGNDIQKCQSQGKRIFLSLGGGEGNYGLSSDDQGNQLAQTLWDMFLGGWSNTRPFGNVKIDGIDLDIEKGDPSHYGALVNRLSALYATDNSKRYYLSYTLPVLRTHHVCSLTECLWIV